VPSSVLYAKVMQTVTRFNDGTTNPVNPVLEEADLVAHHPIAFHSTNSVFSVESDQ
jgi:hypothetical protein